MISARAKSVLGALFASATLMAGVLAEPSIARADDLEGNLVYLPVPNGESLSVDNRLGAVRLRGWDEPQVRILCTKRARSPGVLDRLKVRVDINGGRIRVVTGVYFQDNVWRPVPLGDAGIDLTIDAPRQMALGANTFRGDIDASGFRAGARLESQQGEIRAADIQGRVDTRSTRGRQWLQSIRGPLEASGIEGDLELEAIEGETLEASVYKGQITAREVRSPVVHLRGTIGSIVFVGALQAGGRYQLEVHSGDIRLALRPTPFRLVAHGPVDLGALVLTNRRSPAPGVIEGDHLGGGPLLDLASATGSIRLTPIK